MFREVNCPYLGHFDYGLGRLFSDSSPKSSDFSPDPRSIKAWTWRYLSHSVPELGMFSKGTQAQLQVCLGPS